MLVGAVSFHPLVGPVNLPCKDVGRVHTVRLSNILVFVCSGSNNQKLVASVSNGYKLSLVYFPFSIDSSRLFQECTILNGVGW